ncbi:hypothetical protein B7463_g6805, partial [Scytalidium lignicola]
MLVPKYNLYYILSVVVIACGGIPKGYDEGGFSAAVGLSSFKNDFQLNSSEWKNNNTGLANRTANITSFGVLGAAFGSLLALVLTDRLGRLRCWQGFIILWATGILMQAFSSGILGLMLFARLWGGLGAGGLTVVAPLYLSEIARAKVSRHDCFFINYAASKNMAATPEQYRLVMVVPLIPVGLAFIGSFFLSDTPRWLASQDYVEEALNTLRRLRGTDAESASLTKEFSEIHEEIQLKQQNLRGVGTVTIIKEIFVTPSFRKRFLYYIPQIFVYAGVTGSNSSLITSGAYGITKLFFTLLFTWGMIDIIGRRRCLLSGLGLQFVAHVWMAIYMAVFSNGHNKPASDVTIAAVYVYAVGWSVGLCTVQYLYGTEIFPTRIRSVCYATNMALHWFFQFAVVRVTPNMLVSLHIYGAFVFWAVICAVGFVLLGLWAPETKNVPMERMEELFSGPWYSLWKAKVDFNESDESMLSSEKKEMIISEHLEDKIEELKRLHLSTYPAVHDPLSELLICQEKRSQGPLELHPFQDKAKKVLSLSARISDPSLARSTSETTHCSDLRRLLQSPVKITMAGETKITPQAEQRIGYAPVAALQEYYEALDNLSLEEYAAKEKKLVHKIDLRLMPLLFLMIVLNYLDRNALANARVQGIEKSIGLKGNEFNTAISVLFAGYIALQIPSNMIITRVRPSLYLPGCMIIWGIVSGMTATVQNFKGLVIVRPYFPGALFLLSSWYTRKELALRTSILYSGSLLSGGFGGLIGAGVQSGLDGAKGIASWRWLFIIEASITVFIAAIALFVLPDFPHTTSFLSGEEKAIATRRLETHSGSNDTERGSMVAGVKMAVIDYKVWCLALIITTKTSAGAVTSFIPTLVATLGKGKVESLLLVAPPYIFATIIALGVSRASDRMGERCYHIVVPILFGMVGFIIAASTLNFAARYASLFLMLAGVYGSYNVALAWISSTLPQPIEKRAAAIALVNTVGNFAQIYSPYMYPSSDGPQYLTAMIANSCFCLGCIIMTLLLRFCLVRENKKLEAFEVQQATALSAEKLGLETVEDIARSGEFMAAPGFRYCL